MRSSSRRASTRPPRPRSAHHPAADPAAGGRRAQFHLDAVLGAFLAGMVLRRWAAGDVPALEGKLDAVGYGFFIPVFFVYSGMTMDLESMVAAPLRVLMFFALMLWSDVCRRCSSTGGRSDARERWQMMLITATALPLLVALAEIGLRNGTMLPENAAALVGAGVLTVLVFPAAAVVLQRPPIVSDAPTPSVKGHHSDVDRDDRVPGRGPSAAAADDPLDLLDQGRLPPGADLQRLRRAGQAAAGRATTTRTSRSTPPTCTSPWRSTPTRAR